MNKHLILQEQFQKLAGQTKFGLGQVPDVETRKLRLKLALEELCELAEAFGLIQSFDEMLQSKIHDGYDKNVIDTNEYNPTEALDAMIDSAIINYGSVITCGFEEIFDREYENVDTNNKTKFHTDYDEAVKTQSYYSVNNVYSDIQEIKLNDVSFYVIKNKYGKVLKPYNYEPVKLNLNK